MGLFDLFRKRKTVFEPGDPIEIRHGTRARVWDVYVERVAPSTIEITAPDGEARVTLQDLPCELGRYVVRREGDRSIAVETPRLPDEAFLGTHATWLDIGCSPLASFDFRGVVIDGPRVVSFNESMSTDPCRTTHVPKFVVSGFYQFTAAQLRELTDEPNRAIHLVIQKAKTGATERHSIRSIADTYEYEVVGINRSPAPESPWVGPPDSEGFVSTGGYFNMPLGLYVHDPLGTPYELRVHAECGEHRSETLTIRIED